MTLPMIASRHRVMVMMTTTMTTTTTTMMMTTTTTTMTTTTIEPDLEVEERSDLGVWKWTSVGAMAGAALLVGATAGTEGCTLIERAGLFVGWIGLPAVALAALGVVAIAGSHRVERTVAATIGGVLGVMWIYGLLWSSVGVAIDGLAC